MAPDITSRDLHPDVLGALQRAAKRRHRMAAVHKEQQPNEFGAQGYQRMRKKLNKTKFIRPLDADTTKCNIYYIKKRFIGFCRENKHGPWKNAIKAKNCDKGLIMTFLHWICKTYVQPRLVRGRKSKQKSINQYWRDFKLLYRRANKGRVINGNDCEEVVKYIRRDLTEEFHLDMLPKPKPVLGVDDLLMGLTHHWSRDRSVFPTEADRLDLPTIMLFQAYTACRPAELVDGTKSRGGGDPLKDEPDDWIGHRPSAHGPQGVSRAGLDDDDMHDAMQMDSYSDEDEDENDEDEEDRTSTFDDDGYDSDMTCDTELDDEEVADDGSHGEAAGCSRTSHGPRSDELGNQTREHKALCYEDITLWMVKDPNQGGRDVLAMEVYFRYHKGSDNKPKPTVFLFREHPLAILCPISHILARAILDDAVEVGGYTTAEPFFSTRLGKRATKVNWKPSVMQQPLFRKSVRTATGGWEKSKSEPMRYSTYALYLDRIGQGLGSEEKWTSYCMRRGNANAILGRAPDMVVDQVMRHDPMTGCLANAYLNHRVGFNVQDAFLERDPSADGLTRAFIHMSIRCNPEIPTEIPRAELDKIDPDPDIVSLSMRVRQMFLSIRREYRFIKRAPQIIRDEYRQLQRDLRNVEKNFRDDMTRVYQDALRRRIHNEELERQLSGTAAADETEPVVQHQLEERNNLQAILCDFNMDLDWKRLTERKITAINLMVALASRREIRAPRPSPSCGPSPGDMASNVPPAMKYEEIPLVLKRTQCIYCVGDETLSYRDRTRTFSRVSHMMDHVENVHLRREPVGRSFVCHHPDCKLLGDFLEDLDHFKHHVRTVHGVKLRQ
ncbi:FluG domain-containing protein [Pleurostoma richardsiae]|uniref:FluG domain-containing protein n=1 Tax=Pleurostoma richardsiae TaxID=41990 RepID=A0AA38RCE0_9PEZI|nr:FluG domain-containing protein [Pleurostoma richardsiae]